MHARVVTDLSTVDATAWDALNGTDNPFLRHAFLAGLEATGCVHAELGWQPYHLILEDEDGIAAAQPGYLKGHSRGEFVFDFAWADAFARTGRAYYPKLLHAIPFTPATGPRLLTRPGQSPRDCAAYLAGASREVVERLDLSSAHWLFPEPEAAGVLEHQGLLARSGCQFHWTNPGYRDFDDFLDTLRSRRRKAIRRERRQAHEAGLSIELRTGDTLPESDWEAFHALYSRTFHAYGNRPPLSTAFLAHCGRSLGDRVLMVQARREGRMVAAALLLRSGDTLYGRYWGCEEEWPGLHFEACYYQGIEYCIDAGLSRFEPGAQGEHKISRGFLPVETHSLHWVAEPRLRDAIADFLARETPLVHDYIDAMNQHSPYRDARLE